MKTDGQLKKSGLTSPTSPAKKVCFADFVGLKLEFVKTITPCSSEDDLCTFVGAWKLHCDINGNLPKRRLKCLFPCFVRPSEQTDSFMKRVYSQNVCLENIACENFVVTGIIRVTNLSFTKEVTVRFTLNGWMSYRDIWADYMSTCADGKTDKFSFRITVPHDFEVNRHMEFAIRYRVSNQEFWDNNNRNNYHVQCLEVSPEQF
ncbi:protein phosphatase 1 regulatory subunit 3C-like [Oculina patagonica]